MKILPHTAPYPFTLASLLGVSEHVVVHAVEVVCGLCLGGRGVGCRLCSPTAPGRCLHFGCRGAPARVRAWRCEGGPPLPHHFVCGDVYLTLPQHNPTPTSATRTPRSTRGVIASPRGRLSTKARPLQPLGLDYVWTRAASPQSMCVVSVLLCSTLTLTHLGALHAPHRPAYLKRSSCLRFSRRSRRSTRYSSISAGISFIFCSI